MPPLSVPWLDNSQLTLEFICTYSMGGYDCSFHIAEECSNAAIATPRSIIMTAVSGSVLGFVLNTLIAYTIVDVDAAMGSELVTFSPSFLPCLLSGVVYLGSLHRPASLTSQRRGAGPTVRRVPTAGPAP